ncbi:MAG: glycosyltransferase [Flavobacteriales bacterium]|nr:glycosyltransferase [Flavobacteriales bacterium]
MNNQLKVLFYLSDFALGGSERQAINLATYWKNQNIADVEFLSTSIGKEVPQMLERHGITHHVIPFLFQMPIIQRILTLTRIVFQIRKINPSVILCYGTQANIAVGLLGKLTGAKVRVWQQRGIEVKESTPGRMERWAFSNCTHVIANSEEGKNYVKERFPLLSQSKPIEVIYNGINHIQLNQASTLKKEFENDWIVVQLANLTRYKDFDTLLEGWKKFTDSVLIENGKTPKLLLAGAGPQEVHIKSKAFNLDLCHSVHFVGKVSINDILGWPKLFLLSSKSEGQPNALLEPMFHGHLVFGSKISGIVEALGHNHADNLTFANSDELSELLNRYYRDESHFGLAHAEIVERTHSEFNLASIASKYTEYLQLKLY